MRFRTVVNGDGVCMGNGLLTRRFNNCLPIIISMASTLRFKGRGLVTM